MLIKVIKYVNYNPFALFKTISVVCYNSQNSRYLEFSSSSNLTRYMFSYGMQLAAALNINLNLYISKQLLKSYQVLNQIRSNYLLLNT